MKHMKKLTKPEHYRSEKIEHHEVDKRPKTEKAEEIKAPMFDTSLHHSDAHEEIIPSKSSY